MKKIVWFLIFIPLLIGCTRTQAPEMTGEEAIAPVLEATAEESESKQENSIHTRLKTTPVLDPAKGHSEEDFWVQAHLFTGLLTYDENGALCPGVAYLPTLSEDGKTCTFTLREDAKWNNGDPILPEDFIRGWKRLFSPEQGFGEMLFFLEGAEAYSGLMRLAFLNEETRAALITEDEDDFQEKLREAEADLGLEATDNRLILHLNQPFDPLNSWLTHPRFSPCHPNRANQNDSSIESFIGNGPFIPESLTDECLHLTPIDENEEDLYFHIIADNGEAWNRYEFGDLDIYMDPPSYAVEEAIKNEDPSLYPGQQNGVILLRFQMDRQPLESKPFRRCLADAINREKLCENSGYDGQIPATGFVPYGYDIEGTDFRERGNYLWDVPEEELQENKALFQEALEILPEKTGITKLTYEATYQNRILVEEILRQWDDNLGFHPIPEELSSEEFMKRKANGDFDVILDWVFGEYGHPSSLLHTLSHCNPGNYGYYFDEDFQAKLHQADEENTMESYEQAERILMQDMPVIPLCFTGRAFVVKPYLLNVLQPKFSYPLLFHANRVK